jgi:hypothetical protein|tara:strand:+ start:2767 stop:3111 length:345 start_codon:yes stop_codon:yes gene_type:complete
MRHVPPMGRRILCRAEWWEGANFRQGIGLDLPIKRVGRAGVLRVLRQHALVPVFAHRQSKLFGGHFDGAKDHAIDCKIFADWAVCWTELSGNHRRLTATEILAEARAAGFSFEK